jgi:hypothetical protein
LRRSRKRLGSIIHCCFERQVSVFIEIYCGLLVLDDFSYGFLIGSLPPDLVIAEDILINLLDIHKTKSGQVKEYSVSGTHAVTSCVVLWHHMATGTDEVHHIL